MTFLLLLVPALWALGFLFLYRVPLCRAAASPKAHPSLSIVIPARNEEANLPALLQSLAGQGPAEILVVDDASTDRTAEVAREAGARVLASAPLPEGWRGKTWACFQGAQAATGEVLLFVDADTGFEPGGLRRIVDTWLEGRGVLSIGPYHRTRRPYEELSAFFNLLMTAGTGAFTVLGQRVPPAGLFGQCLMLSREDYFAVGGHEPVRGKILENFHLAREFRRAGIAMRCCGGRGALSMRMYPGGLGELVAGWGKAFASGAAQTPLPILLATVVWTVGAVLAAILAFVSGYGLILYLLYALQLRFMLARIGSFRAYTALFYPVPLAFYFAVFTRSSIAAALGRPVSWKGRAVEIAPPRK